jgi:hypothetical protein
MSCSERRRTASPTVGPSVVVALGAAASAADVGVPVGDDRLDDGADLPRRDPVVALVGDDRDYG